MSKLKIEDPQTFQFASPVIKESKSGFSSNRRLLVVRGGHLYYFSNIPPFFNGNPKDLEFVHELPKHSIELINVKKIKPFESSSCTFQITFDEIYLMEREDIRKTLIEHLNFVPKTKGDQISWRFTCDNNVLKHKWVTYLAQLRDYFIREKEKIDKYFFEINHKQENLSVSCHSLSSNKLGAKTPWRESTVLRKQYSAVDFKSMIDISESQLGHNFDHGFKKSKEDFRLTNSFAPEVGMQTFGLQEQNLYRTDPGFTKEMKMKKMHSTNNASSKLF